MTQSIHPAAKNGFSAGAERYQQTRPDYPPEIVQWLKQHLHLTEQAHCVDLGAGTGKFLASLQQVTSQITAVEPVSEMIGQLKTVYPEITCIQATSTDIPLNSNSIDAVVCAQSFHWFADSASLAEIHRILKPQGQLALIWNQRDVQVDWVKALADFIADYEQDTPRFHSQQWQQVFDHQALFGPAQLSQFSHIQRGTVEQVVSQRLLSTSFIAAMPPAEQQHMKQKFEQIVMDYTSLQAHDQIDFPYITYAYQFEKLSV